MRDSAVQVMGRVKLKIKKLETPSNRQVTYSKRRNGILKKAKELSILCDIDIVLLMLSPTEKFTLFHGERSNIQDVITKFSQLAPQERAKRKLESLEALKKTFKKLDHDVDIQEFLGISSQSVEGLTEQVRLMQCQLAQVHQRLSCWSNPEKIDNIDCIRQMEESLEESITRVRLHKESIGRRQLVPVECSSQFQNGMLYPMMMGTVPEAQPLSWIPNNRNQHFSLSNDPSFLQHREGGCSADISLPSYSGYFVPDKQHEMGNSGSAETIVQEGGALSELSSIACLPSQQHNEQVPCLSYSAVNLMDIKKMDPGMDMNLQGNHALYQVNGNFELPRLVDESRHHPWFAASGPCDVTMFGGNSYHQQPN